MSARTIAFLAGMGVGASNTQDKLRQQAREDERDQWAREDRVAQVAARDRALADQQALRDAAAPVPVEEVPLPGPTQDGAPLPTAYRVAGKDFASQGVAADTAEQTRRGRVQAVLASQDPVKGEQFRAATAQTDEAVQKAKSHVEAMLKEGTLDALGAAMSGASPDEVKAIFNRYGKSKVAELTVEPYQIDHPTLGKVTSARLVGKMEDGSPIQIDDAFNNSLQLFGAAKKLDLLDKWASEKRAQDNKTRDQERQDAAEERRGKHEDRMYEAALRQTAAAERRAAAAEAKGSAAPGAPVVTLKDMREFEADVDKRLSGQFDPKDGMTPEEKAKIGAARTALATQASGIFRANAELGMPVTADIALAAIQAASDRTKVRNLRGSDGNVYATVAVNGRPVVVSGALQPGQAQPQAPQPAAAEPGVGSFIADLARRGVAAAGGAAGNMQAQGAAYQAIDARVRQALAGGPPLTPQELETARQFGIQLPR